MTDILPISDEQHKRLKRDLERAKDAISAALQEMNGVLPPRKHTMEESSVAEWLATQDCELTAYDVARAVFPNATMDKSLSMKMSQHLKAAGWRYSRRLSSKRYWNRGPQAQPARAAMPAPTDT